MQQTNEQRSRRWILVTLASCILLNSIAVAFFVMRGEPLRNALSVTAPGQAASLLRPTDDDSWRAMAKAHRYHTEDPAGDLYGVFFDGQVKYQYPPSALLFWKVFTDFSDERPGNVPGGPLLRGASLLALIFTIVLSILILRSGLNRLNPREDSRVSTAAVFALSLCLLGVSFYPLIKGFALGQVQVFIGLLIAAGLLAYMNGMRSIAGVCIGMCCVFKPQYAVVLLWGLVRRDWRFVGAFVLVGALALAASIMEFGLYNHLRYLAVLGDLSSHGEAFWPNQSVNGLANRFFENGDAQRWQEYAFPPYHPVVYYATVISSAVLIAVSLWPVSLKNGKERSNVFDLAVALMAATIASPVAWEHHYGSFLPLFAVALPVLMQVRPAGRWTGALLLLSYLAIANVVLRPDLIFRDPWWGLLGSHLFFGALILTGLCMISRGPAHQALLSARLP